MSKWLNLFLENEIVNRSDKSDRFKFEPNMSPLSLCPLRLLDEKMEKVENNHSKGGDKSAKFRFETNMSPLSLRPQGLLDEKMVNTPEPDISNKSDKSDPNLNFSSLLGSSLRENFEERLAVAEYDGQQTPRQAQRIAYLDAFMAALATLPHETSAQEEQRKHWLEHKISSAREWLNNHGIQEPE